MNVEKIILNGKFYCPAYTHYGSNPLMNIKCDSCFRNQLRVSVGYQDYDLCVNCVEHIAAKMNFNINDIIGNNYKKNPIIFPTDYLTRMASTIYYPSNKYPLTLMVQEERDWNKSKIIKKKFKLVDSTINCLGIDCKHKVIIDDSLIELDGFIIARKYWDMLNEKEKNHFSKFIF